MLHSSSREGYRDTEWENSDHGSRAMLKRTWATIRWETTMYFQADVVTVATSYHTLSSWLVRTHVFLLALQNLHPLGCWLRLMDTGPSQNLLCISESENCPLKYEHISMQLVTNKRCSPLFFFTRGVTPSVNLVGRPHGTLRFKILWMTKGGSNVWGKIWIKNLFFFRKKNQNTFFCTGRLDSSHKVATSTCTKHFI